MLNKSTQGTHATLKEDMFPYLESGCSMTELRHLLGTQTNNVQVISSQCH